MPDPLPCRRITPKLWGYLADDLDACSESEVEHHLYACARCRRALEQIETLIRVLRAYPPGTELPDTVHARLTPLLLELERGAAGTLPARACSGHWAAYRPR